MLVEIDREILECSIASWQYRCSTLRSMF